LTNRKDYELYIEKCRKYGVTVNSALNTAFLAARYSIRGSFKGGRQNIMLPVNLRKRYKNPVGEQFGHYAAGFQFKLSYNPKLDFWENVKNFNKKMKQNLDINKVFEFAALTGIIDQSIVDARSFSLLGKLVPSYFSRYEKIQTFSNDGSNIVNKRARKQIPELPGLAITNLGRLDYPVKYGSLELDRFIFVTIGSPFIELIVSVVTVAGRLSFTINYLEEITDSETMEKIKNKVLECLN